MNYDAVIFDKDGVLLDSMGDGFKWADRIRVKMARDRGKEIDMDDSRLIVRAATVKELEEAARETGLDIDTIREMEDEIAKRKIEKIKKGDIQLFRDTEKVLRSINAPKSVVSNAPYQATKFTVQKFDLEDHFEAIKSPPLEDIREYVRLKKPSTYMLKEVIEEMAASNPVMVGDSDDDILAARNAGIDSIFVNTNGGTDLDPTHSVKSLKSILKIVD